MRRGLLIGLAGSTMLAGLWFAAGALQGRRTPLHVATAEVQDLGLAVTAELFVLSDMAEFERRLALGTGGATLRVRMADAVGPEHRTALYRVGGSEIAVVGPSGDGHSFSLGPLRRLAAPSRPFEDWTHLGTFELSMMPRAAASGGQAQVFDFVPAAR